MRPYRVRTVSDLDLRGAARCDELQPDALIAPITSGTLHLFLHDRAQTTTCPTRPLLVLIAETPKPGFPLIWCSRRAGLIRRCRPHFESAARISRFSRSLFSEMGVAEVHARSSRSAPPEEIDLLKNAIVRTVSHELKTPLLHVKSAVAMLADDSERDRAKLIGYAIEATARLEVVDQERHPACRQS